MNNRDGRLMALVPSMGHASLPQLNGLFLREPPPACGLSLTGYNGGRVPCPKWTRLRGYTSNMLNKLEDGWIIPTKLPSTQTFAGGEATNLNGATILEYWQWAYSGTVGNTDRGNLAEFLVAKALAIATDVRNDWADFDLTTTDGTKIEVKSSAFVQSWKQVRIYPPRFSIKKTLPTWDYASTTKQRYADVYVFCLLAHLDKETVNPMDVSQWEFYALRTDVIDRDFGGAQSISLGDLRSSSNQYSYSALRQGVQDLTG